MQCAAIKRRPRRIGLCEYNGGISERERRDRTQYITGIAITHYTRNQSIKSDSPDSRLWNAEPQDYYPAASTRLFPIYVDRYSNTALLPFTLPLSLVPVHYNGDIDFWYFIAIKMIYFMIIDSLSKNCPKLHYFIF